MSHRYIYSIDRMRFVFLFVKIRFIELSKLYCILHYIILLNPHDNASSDLQNHFGRLNIYTLLHILDLIHLASGTILMRFFYNSFRYFQIQHSDHTVFHLRLNWFRCVSRKFILHTNTICIYMHTYVVFRYGPCGAVKSSVQLFVRNMRKP